MKRERLKKNKLSSKEVLEYLSWVTDPGFLYDVALATFDLKLAVMVAETTQKDPLHRLTASHPRRDRQAGQNLSGH